MKLQNNLKLTAIVSIAAAVAFGIQNNAQAASATAQAFQEVVAALAINQVSDIQFGSGFQGDAAKTVAPGTAETPTNASFHLAGGAGLSYAITLPADGTVAMTTGGGGAANKSINVSSFSSFPATSGSLDGSGSGDLFVGASRDALAADQTPGSYAATFTVTVVYN